MEANNLKLRGNTWYARLTIPTQLHAAMGREELVKSLKTRDLREANRLKHAVLAAMHKEIRRAAASDRPRDPISKLLRDAQDFHDSVATGDSTQHNAELAFDATVERHLDHAASLHGVNEDGHPNVTEAHEAAVLLARDVFTTGQVTLLSRAIEDYLNETAPRVRVATITEKRRQLQEFSVWLKVDCAVGAVTKRTAGRYVAEVLLCKGHAPKTVKDALSNLSAFFVWLEGRGLVDINPWNGMSSTVKGSTRGKRPSRRPWSEDELVTLFNGIPENDVIIPLSALALYSGMRLEELADIKTDNVTTGFLRAVEGKTTASVRYVPVHPVIAPMVARLLENARGGYLLPDLLVSGPDNKRGKLVGKRFGKLIRALGISDPSVTFHTLRNSFMSRCEGASVPESTTKLLVGHARQSLTYGLYSPGVEFEQLAAAVQKISFGKVDALMASLGPSLVIKAGQRKRNPKGKAKAAP